MTTSPERESPKTFYRRPLPEELVAFSSAEGRTLFREALAAGTMEAFFALSEQFHTQAEPAFCALGSLVVALNALSIDPGRLWKGPWRWFDETLLDCCVPLEIVAKRGVTISELACLAECNGAHATVVRATDGLLNRFREDVVTASSAAGERVLIVGYDRSSLGQTGSGHFSPIGGYHRGEDRALVLDVARFKYPPHWVGIGDLFEAMKTIDPDTQKPRGWVILERSAETRPLFVRLGVPTGGWRAILDELREEIARAGSPDSAEAWARSLVGFGPARTTVVAPLANAMVGELALEHRTYVDALVAEVRTTRAFEAASRSIGERSEADAWSAEVAAILALVLAREAPATGELGPTLSGEIAAVRRQLEALCAARI